jgi:hypothetical protein
VFLVVVLLEKARLFLGLGAPFFVLGQLRLERVETRLEGRFFGSRVHQLLCLLLDQFFGLFLREYGFVRQVLQVYALLKKILDTVDSNLLHKDLKEIYERRQSSKSHEL